MSLCLCLSPYLHRIRIHAQLEYIKYTHSGRALEWAKVNRSEKASQCDAARGRTKGKQIPVRRQQKN